MQSAPKVLARWADSAPAERRVISGPMRLEVSEAVREWAESLALSRSARTVTIYRAAVRYFLASAPRSGKLHAYTRRDIVQWLDGFASPATRRVYYHGVHSFFSFCGERGYTRDDISAGIKVPNVRQKMVRALTPDELCRLVYAAANRAPTSAWAIALLYYSGCRLGEAVALRWEDVEQNQLRIRHGKGDKERVIPIEAGLRATLAALRDSAQDGRVLPCRERTLWQWVRDAGTDAGLSYVHPHTLRATCATTMLRRGAAPDVVQNMLGHSKLETTMRHYHAWCEDDKHEAAALL